MKLSRITRSGFAVLAVAMAVSLSGWQTAAAAEKKAPAKHFLWVVKSKTATVYLLGSVHVAKKEIYPLDAVINSAFKKSDTLVLEIPMNAKTQAEAGAKLLAAARYGAGDSLDKHLSAAVNKQLNAYLATQMIPQGAFNQFRPWMVSIALTMQVLQKSGFKAEHGIDQHFFKRATGKKNVLGLETVDDQVNMFKGLTDLVQAKMLKQTLDEIDTTSKTISKTFAAWKTGDAKALDDMMLKPMRAKEFRTLYKALFIDRNIKMTKKIEGFLKTKSTYFVVVGSGHLVGERGIVDLLRKAKHKVNQL
jgi:uncharacterized protein